MAILSRALLGTLAVASTAVAHSHVNNLVINGVYWQGYDPTSYPYQTDPPVVVGWTAANLDNGFVSPDAFQTGDIICHKDATPAGGHATVNAGDSISIQWGIEWPDSHKGPVLDYLAKCDGDCETVDKTTLQFFKIDQVGYLNGSDPGTWASDVLLADASSWLVRIPADLAPGNYVLRHEIIALHSAGQANGAQSYPQCFNLAVAGGGTGALSPSGTYGTDLYRATDPGILYNVYTSVEDYTIPGPTLYTGFASSVAQSSSVATATSSAVVPGGGGDAGGATTTTSNGGGGGVSSTTTVASTTSLTTTTTTSRAAATTTSAAAATGGQTQWGQCGGSGWTGPSSCASGACTTYNPYYAQCV